MKLSFREFHENQTTIRLYISENDNLAHGISTRITRQFRCGAGNYVESMWFGNFVLYISAVATILPYHLFLGHLFVMLQCMSESNSDFHITYFVIPPSQLVIYSLAQALNLRP